MLGLLTLHTRVICSWHLFVCGRSAFRKCYFARDLFFFLRIVSNNKKDPLNYEDRRLYAKQIYMKYEKRGWYERNVWGNRIKGIGNNESEGNTQKKVNDKGVYDDQIKSRTDKKKKTSQYCNKSLKLQTLIPVFHFISTCKLYFRGSLL